MSRSETEIQVQKLKELIQTGKMTIEELKDRLHLIIDTELLKDDEEVDIDLIKACESFFTHLHGKEEPLSEKEYQEQWAKIQERVKAQGTKKRIFRKAPVYAAVAVAAILILFFGISIKFQWFLPSSTPDGQQYVITGKEITIDTISRAIASHDSGGRFDTEQIERMEDYLGFSIKDAVPNLDGWKVDNYYASILSSEIFLRVIYRNSQNNDDVLTYVIHWITDFEDLNYIIEQNEVGNSLMIGNQAVYRSENYEYISYTWFIGTTYYSVFGISTDSVIDEFLEG